MKWLEIEVEVELQVLVEDQVVALVETVLIQVVQEHQDKGLQVVLVAVVQIVLQLQAVVEQVQLVQMQRLHGQVEMAVLELHLQLPVHLFIEQVAVVEQHILD